MQTLSNYSNEVIFPTICPLLVSMETNNSHTVHFILINSNIIIVSHLDKKKMLLVN